MEQTQDEFASLFRGAEEVIGKKELLEKLKAGKKLRVKLGIDPTSPNLHLGRSIPLLKLRDFQEAGHQIIFLVGDFTGVIGDTSDKDSERPMLDEKTVKANMKEYAKQAGKILDTKKAEIVYNSKWLKKLKYAEIGRQADQFSINEFISRENIKKRLDEGKRVSLREVLYPMMQGYDSVELEADVEIGGLDQRFNLLAGRELQRMYGQEPQSIVMTPLINGLDGRKMSSSWGNTVNLIDSARDMFGKIMSLHDELIIQYFLLVTRVDEAKIAEFDKQLSGGANPRDIKIELAKAIVTMYHSSEDAEMEAEAFLKTFSQGEVPDDAIEVSFDSDRVNILEVMKAGLDDKMSGSDMRRMVEQGAVKVDDDVVVKTLDTDVDISTKERVVKVGKRNWIKVSKK